METKVFAAGPPKEGEYVLQWRSATMPAPAFWYFETKEKAKLAEVRLQWHRPDQIY